MGGPESPVADEELGTAVIAALVEDHQDLLRRVTAYVLELNQPYQSIDQFQFAPAGDVRLANNAIEASSAAAALGFALAGGILWRSRRPAPRARVRTGASALS